MTEKVIELINQVKNQATLLTAEELKDIENTGNQLIKSINAIRERRKELGLKPVQHVIAALPIKYLTIDDYQRDASINHVKDLIVNFDIDKLEPIKVSFRNGKIYIIDGYHRVLSALANGETEVTAECYVGLTYKEEAKIFASQDEHSRRVDTVAKFKAELEACTTRATAINEIAKAYGWTINFESGRKVCAKQLKAITEVVRVYNAFGAPGVRRIFQLFEDAGWQNYDETAMHCYISMGNVVCRIEKYINSHPGYGTFKEAYDKIVAEMKNKRPGEFLGDARTKDPNNTQNMHSDERALRCYLQTLAGLTK